MLVFTIIFTVFQTRTKDQTELPTIPEHEAIPLTLASPQHRINLEVNSKVTTSATSEPSPNNPTSTSNSTSKSGLDCYVRMKCDPADLGGSEEVASKLADDDVASNNGDEEGDGNGSGGGVDAVDAEENLHSMCRWVQKSN